MEDYDTRLSLQELNQAVSEFFDMYIGYVTAYMQVHEVYKPFLKSVMMTNAKMPLYGRPTIGHTRRIMRGI